MGGSNLQALSFCEFAFNDSIAKAAQCQLRKRFVVGDGGCGVGSYLADPTFPHFLPLCGNSGLCAHEHQLT